MFFLSLPGFYLKPVCAKGWTGRNRRDPKSILPHPSPRSPLPKY